ncbi:conserved hypothetical protein [Prochlorococcus marinus str. MIT 9211]|uniref:Uncharacterized protein n=2 Tax=Prochlorococcus marinus TaxID=1219 RepID=A9BD78_PROM4|nr:conserved hypothetical protein [Prochlorococcus marinus str. MIT 9211]
MILNMKFILKCYWLLLILGIFAPIDLPVGGTVRNNSDLFQFESSDRYFAGDNCYLRASPSLDSPEIRSIALGTPLRILRSWQSEDKKNWIQVEISSFKLLSSSSQLNRGWLNV